jgi:hypothetical protein
MDRLYCILKAERIACPMVIIENQICRLYIKWTFGVDESYLVESNNSEIFLNQEHDESMIHYWPFNNNLNDVASNNDLIEGHNFSFTVDRFKNKYSAVYLKDGYLQVPSGIYFYGDFTVSVWVNPISPIGRSDRIIDFGGNNVILGLFLGTNAFFPYFCILDSNYVASNYVSNQRLEINKWQHVALTFRGTNGKLYINGKEVRTATTQPPRPVLRTKNFIGRSNIGGDSQSVNALFDDLKIFNRSLTQDEILFIFRN